METWSFDRAINEVFRLLPPELCPRSTEEHAQAKPLSGIEQLMESQSTPLLILPQSKLIENTARFLQDKIDTEKFSRDWVCSQSLVSSLTQIKFYKSQSIFSNRQYSSVRIGSFPVGSFQQGKMLHSNEELGNMGKKSPQTYSDQFARGSIFFCCIPMYAAADNVCTSTFETVGSRSQINKTC